MSKSLLFEVITLSLTCPGEMRAKGTTLISVTTGK